MGGKSRIVLDEPGKSIGYGYTPKVISPEKEKKEHAENREA